MWNLLLGYLVTRALVGDRAVRTGVLVVLVSVGLLLSSASPTSGPLLTRSS